MTERVGKTHLLRQYLGGTYIKRRSDNKANNVIFKNEIVDLIYNYDLELLSNRALGFFFL